jgi:tetratricopeptide (TPR) repeat protein
MADEQPRPVPAPERRVRTLCPVLVGRDREIDTVRSALDAAAGRCGRTVAVSGEAGIGKTRLVREAVAAARARSMTTLVGRCLQHGQVPYRPLAEALLAVARAGALPDVTELAPFRHALGTIVPDWRVECGAEASPVVLGEGVLRVARVLGGPAGTLLVVEDLHWADTDTIAVLEYLADNLTGQPLVLLVTVRASEAAAAAELVSRLELRGAVQVLELGRLRPAEVAAMAAACADAAGVAVPRDVVEIVGERSEGLPLLVEELLSVPASGISQAVPGTFADAVTRRMDTLPAESVLVIRCAAVLGRRFDWRLLAAVTALPADRVRRGLADAVDVQIVLVDADGEFRFRHALTRDAVLAATLPPTRVALARRAARAVDVSDDDTRAVLAADLWRAAGAPVLAARGLLAAGRRATARGALTTAERLLERARDLPVDDPPTRSAVAEALTEVLALAAKVDRAFAVGAEALDLLDAERATPARRARLHLMLARAADAAGRWSLAADHLTRSGGLGRAAGDERLLTAVQALAAHVAIGEGRYDDAERLATAAADRAVALDLPEVAREALEVLGRRERLRDLGRAEAVFERAHGIARDGDLVLWSIRSLHELGTIDMLCRSSPTRRRCPARRAGLTSTTSTPTRARSGCAPPTGRPPTTGSSPSSRHGTRTTPSRSTTTSVRSDPRLRRPRLLLVPVRAVQQRLRHQARPAGLVRRAEAGAGVAVEVLVDHSWSCHAGSVWNRSWSPNTGRRPLASSRKSRRITVPPSEARCRQSDVCTAVAGCARCGRDPTGWGSHRSPGAPCCHRPPGTRSSSSTPTPPSSARSSRTGSTTPGCASSGCCRPTARP